MDQVKFRVVPVSQTINLSTLIFNETIITGEDKVIVNGNNYTQALTITGSSIDDEITGTPYLQRYYKRGRH